MASLFLLKPTHSPVKAYYAALSTFHEHGHNTEGNTRPAFAALLRKCASPYEWHLVEEFPFKGTGKQPLRADGALVDKFTLQHGIWEAKDTGDDLATEIKKKRDKGYPLVNTLFQSPTHAVLYQDNRIAFDEPITSPEKLVEVLQLFFEHQQPDIPDWKDAVTQFSAKIAELATGVNKILTDEHKRNATFRENFQAFADLCRQSINPDFANPAIQNMLVQHLLTERVFRKVFNNNEFLQRNVIAVEIENVIRSITTKYFSRDEFLKTLDPFYKSIEKAAEAQTEYTEKQHFLNAVYEKFFQNFDAKQADTMGIVYTPQPIVDFMVRSVDEILQQEFGKTLSDKGVHILDPFTGTGNFINSVYSQSMKNFRYLALIVMLGTALYSPATATAAQMTVGDLYKFCTSSNEADKSACSFYILGVFEGAQIGGATAQDKTGQFVEAKVKRFCVPEGLSSSAMELTIKMKMGLDLAVYPQDRDMPAVSFVTAVIAREFPCQSGK